MNLQMLAAKYALNMLSTDEMPRIATELLVEGIEGQSVACLAGSIQSDLPAERRELFEAILKECAIAVPSRLEAAHTLKLYFAKQVAHHQLDPVEGAAMIVDLYYKVEELLPSSAGYVGEAFDIAHLLGLYYSLDDIAADDPHYPVIEAKTRNRIAQECRRIGEVGQDEPVEVATIWIFNGGKSSLPSGAFSSRSLAEEWISKNKLTGILTAYPVNISVYDWAIGLGRFEPKTSLQRSARFIQQFNSAYLEHYHYDNGTNKGAAET